MSEIYYLNRALNKIEKEKIYGKIFITLFYGRCSKIFSPILQLICRIPFFSRLYGHLQKSKRSSKKIASFIKTYHIDSSEFLLRPEEYSSFNDFFTRKLKPKSRPIAKGADIAILPADGRYLVFPSFPKQRGIWVKNKNFSLHDLLQNKELADKYTHGSCAIARLAPVDYHRFHFLSDGVPSKARQINGYLYSVNPKALMKNIAYLTENKRSITIFSTKHFGQVLYIEVGATYVGSIEQTYTPEVFQKKGAEKGFFSFGGSCIILLFQPNVIAFAEDLIQATEQKLEVLGKYGQILGKSLL